MPIYEYYCPKCRKEFELMRPLSQTSEPAFCSTCGEQGQKLFSNCASKIDFYIKTPSKPPFRGEIKPSK